MPFQIRHKESGQIVQMNSGKSVWAKPGHAKASLRTSGPGWKQRTELGLKRFYHFDTTDLFEMVEIIEADKVRFCFVTDDDCHNYLIPAELSAAFEQALEDGDEDGYAEFNNTFEQYRIDSMTNWTFADPKENA